jgi:RhtB (resistance to homoserine/threonine) family protein
MHTSFLTFGIVMLLGAMLPGADFAFVTKNSLLHSRKAGIYTALGIGAGMCIHMTYCVLGLAVIIRQSSWLFHGIQYAGALYLVYLSIMLLKPHFISDIETTDTRIAPDNLSAAKAFQQGFICNLLNPKATLFFLTLFSAISTTNTSIWLNLTYALEAVLIALLWFCSLAYLVSHQRVTSWLDRSQRTIEKILGFLLLSLAVFVVFWS